MRTEYDWILAILLIGIILVISILNTVVYCESNLLEETGKRKISNKIWYFYIALCPALLGYLLGELGYRNFHPQIEDYVNGKVEMKIKEIRENNKIIEKDTTYKWKEKIL